VPYEFPGNLILVTTVNWSEYGQGYWLQLFGRHAVPLCLLPSVIVRSISRIAGPTEQHDAGSPVPPIEKIRSMRFAVSGWGSLKPNLTGAQLTRIEDGLRRERQASFDTGGGEGTPKARGGAAPALTEVLEYRPHEDGYLQLELRRYVRRTVRPALAGPTGPSNLANPTAQGISILRVPSPPQRIGIAPFSWGQQARYRHPRRRRRYLSDEVALMRRIALLVTVALVVTAMIAAGAMPLWPNG
jgi:hypothetical protein